MEFRDLYYNYCMKDTKMNNYILSLRDLRVLRGEKMFFSAKICGAKEVILLEALNV